MPDGPRPGPPPWSRQFRPVANRPTGLKPGAMPPVASCKYRGSCTTLPGAVGRARAPLGFLGTSGIAREDLVGRNALEGSHDSLLAQAGGAAQFEIGREACDDEDDREGSAGAETVA